MTWKRKIPGEGACGPCCSWKERFNQLWDRAIGCITKINNITPDGDGKFEIRGGTGVQVTPISNGIEINSTAIGAGIATINNTTPDSNNNFTIAGASGKTGVTATNTTHGVSLSIGDFVSTINNVTSDVFGNLDLTAGNNITITPDSDNNSIEVAVSSSPSLSGMEINGDLEVNGDIIQNGSAYETHAEQIFTKDDYVIMRDGAVAGLATGDYAGFQVKKYDGTNDGRLVIDKDGTARVGDVGSEQPLLTRDEAADLTNSHLLEWDATNYKAIDSGKKVSDFVNGSGNIGSDTKPIKIVNGEAVEITDNLIKHKFSTTTRSINGVYVDFTVLDDCIMQINCINQSPAATGDFSLSLPTGRTTKSKGSTLINSNNVIVGLCFWGENSSTITMRIAQTAAYTGFQIMMFCN